MCNVDWCGGRGAATYSPKEIAKLCGDVPVCWNVGKQGEAGHCCPRDEAWFINGKCRAWPLNDPWGACEKYGGCPSAIQCINI